MKKVLVSVIALGGVILLAGCGANIDAKEFEKVALLCAKNDGPKSVQYFSEINGDGFAPAIVYCNDGARFNVPESMKSKK